MAIMEKLNKGLKREMTTGLDAAIARREQEAEDLRRWVEPNITTIRKELVGMAERLAALIALLPEE